MGASGWEGQEVSAFHRLLQVQGGWVWGFLEGPPPQLLLMDPACPALPTPTPLPERGERSRWLASPECALPSVRVGWSQHSGPRTAGGRPPPPAAPAVPPG